MLQRHGPFSWLEAVGGCATVHDLVDGGRKRERRAGLHGRAGDGGRHDLGRRARVMKLVAGLAVEVLLQYELPMPRDENALDLWRVHRLHRHVDDPFDERLYFGAMHVRELARCGWPAVTARR